MKTRLGRRDVETFSLSFLDAICCGFGAVILLLVLTEVGEPIVFEQTREELEGRVVKLRGGARGDPRDHRGAGPRARGEQG